MCCDLQMLSVQVPGCAGMERLGAPAGPRLRHEHRHHALEWESQQRLQAMVGRLQEMVEQESRARSAAAAERLGLPPSIPLPDGEAGPDKHLQIRVPYQQAELTRPSFQPPPNKSVSDVPEWAAEGGGGGAARRAGGAGGKKDGLLQKATRWWVRMGARPPHCLPGEPRPRRAPPPPPPPCVMVPRRPPPAPPAPRRA
ncbi:proline-rich protein HaeIII subfamily 1 isoform X2 [Plutella xylostella]|uniref:proline-rich protein HaeIII subfamily 1 isoform X2 n=1 Tax=Plutella xylostella TaxID=51655 RepID=UPI0020330F6D|nr:proline-rich protein HaeIII subfamily 1 isoform X2 [Plutella xylostella]